jgi:hypothetical protein
MFKSVKGYEGLYEVNEIGEVYSCERTTSNGKHLRRKRLKGGSFSNDYKFVCLRKDGVNKNHSVHRLVAETFIPNPLNLSDVNHKDGNKLNNHVSNLEWCSRSENLAHAVRIGLVENQCKIRRKVILTFEGNKQILFSTMKDCAEFFGFKKGWLQNRIRKYGCVFNYKNYEIAVQERG